jgi:hypothetical protein
MAKHPEFKAPQGVHVKTPDVGLFGEEPATDESPAIVEPPSTSVEWLEVPDFCKMRGRPYPFTGEPVWLTPDGATEYIAVWRVTREYRSGRFQPVGFWAVRNGGGQKIDFEPLGYRRFEEPIFVPKKRA